MYTRPIGDDQAPSTAMTTTAASSSLREAINSEPIKTASAIALTYHGYRRTNSIIWALIYGALGRWVPAIAVPVALAQGFGERKPCP